MNITSPAPAVRQALLSLNLEPEERVLVAVSGGVDSTALCHLLSEEAAPLKLSLELVIVDHGLRDVSMDVAHVRQISETLSLPLHVLSVTVRTDGGSLQAAARDARYAALRELASERGARWIALGHTRTDQAETMLIQLLRGTGLRGLSGMRAAREDLFRPLLGMPREALVEWLEARHLSWVEDPTNALECYTRNRIRRQVTPLLEQISPGAGERIAACADHLASDREALEAVAQRALMESWSEASGGGISLTTLRRWPRGMWPHVLRLAIAEAGGEVPARRQVEQLMQLIATDSGSRGVDLEGLRVERIYDLLTFSPGASGGVSPSISEERKEIGSPGCYEIGGSDWSFSHSSDCSLSSGEATTEFDGGTLRFPLEVRGLRRGDRIRPLGMDGSRLLSDILVDRKVPFRERNRAMVLTDGVNVLWLVGVMRSAHHPVGGSTTTVLRVETPGIRAF